MAEYENLGITEFFRAVPSGRSVYVGIDPGAEGAVAILYRKEALVFDIPTLKVKRSGGTKTVFNHPAVVSVFRRIRADDKYDVRIALEIAQVQIKGKGANAYTAFRVGVAYGMWPLFLASRGYSVEEVQPGVWKKQMGLAKEDKEFARQRALSLFPRADLLRKKDHNRAEALLLAEWLRRKSGDG